jgi:hypothetical protein
LQVSHFFRPLLTFIPIEKTAVARCSGRVLDMGAGTGLHSAAVRSTEVAKLRRSGGPPRASGPLSIRDQSGSVGQRFRSRMACPKYIGLAVAERSTGNHFFGRSSNPVASTCFLGKLTVVFDGELFTWNHAVPQVFKLRTVLPEGFVAFAVNHFPGRSFRRSNATRWWYCETALLKSLHSQQSVAMMINRLWRFGTAKGAE